MRDKRYYIISIIIAFIVYQFFNFIYFPVNTIFPDEQRFLNEAITFVSSGEFWTWQNRAWEMPLTAIIYSVFYKVTGNVDYTIIAIRLFQSILLILQAILLSKISYIIFKNKEASLLTLIGVLFYPFFIYFQALLLSETIYITIIVISFYFLYKWYDTGFTSIKFFILSCIFLTLSLYSKGTLSYLPPLLVSLFYFFNTKKYKETFKIFFSSILIYIAVMSFWWVRNYNIFNQFIPFTTSSAMNLYLGANSANKYGGVDWSTDVDPIFIEKVNLLTNEIERNTLFKEEAINFILNEPERYMELMYFKLIRFYKFGLNSDSVKSGLIQLIAKISFGLIFIFSIILILIKFREWQKYSAIYLMIIYMTLIHIIFIASVRYRLPLDPFFILFASYSLVYIKDKIFKKNEEYDN